MKKYQSIKQIILMLSFSALFLAACSSACAQYFGSDIQLDSHDSEGYQRAHAAGDIDNDGSPDIVGEDAGHNLFVTRDLAGTPLYEPQSHLAAEAWELYGTALADFDGDGDLDLVTAGPNGADDSPNNIYYWDNTAKRYDKAGSTLALFSQAIYGYDVLAGDFNSDGKPDVLWLGYNAAYLAINSTTSQDILQFSSFTSTQLSDVNFTRGAMGSALGDFNGDGNLDFITCKSDWNYGSWGGYYELGYGDGVGGFTVENGGNSSDGRYPMGVAAGDLDKDGKDEFVLVRGVWGGSSEMLLYKRNAANNGFDITTVRTDVNGAYWGSVVADINNDGWPDILFEPDSSGEIAIHLNQQDGTFLAANDTRFYASHYQFFIFDMNSDGMQDLLLSENTIYYKLQVLLQAITTDEISGYDGESWTATGYGTIISTGDNEITERGFCHNTTGSPSLDDGSCYGESGSFTAESFSMTIWGLEPNNTYYIRAYAASSAGTAYGGEISFQTPDTGSGDPDTTTTIEEDTTTIPEDTTTIPEDTTTIPEDTTTIPEDTTTIPDDTTTIPEDMTTTTTSIFEGSIITTVTGAGRDTYSGDGGQATRAGISPRAIAFDGNGNMYISDSNNHRIRKVNTSGIITTVAGNGGYGGYSGDGGPATAAELNYPCGIAVDSVGNIIFSDYFNFRIRKVNTSGIITTVAGTGENGYNGDGGPATAAQLSYAIDVAVDGSDNVYIADCYNQRIRKVDTAGIITTVAGVGGAYGYSGDGGLATAAQLSYPNVLAVDRDGIIYFVDSNNYRIRKVDAAGTITTVAGTGDYGYSGDGGPASEARVGYPGGIAVASAGTLYFSDGNRVRKITAAGIIITIAGTGDGGYSGDDGPAVDAQVSNVFGVTLDGTGTSLYIGDADNYRVRKINNLSNDGTTTTTTAPTAPDTDADGIADAMDNCQYSYNPQQLDADDDGAGDLCDTAPGCGGCGQAACEQKAVDSDGDGVADVIDTCPTMANPLNLDADADGIGDVCDTNPGCSGDGQPVCESFDSDGDGNQNYFDNCPAMANPGQLDADADGLGDACDPTPGCSSGEQPECEYFDTDGDGVENRFDNCPTIANHWQRDTDGDGAGDACDASPGCGGVRIPYCEYFDTDDDGIQNRLDNCKSDCNRDQHDADGDGIGDVCDPTPGCGWAGQPACEARCQR